MQAGARPLQGASPTACDGPEAGGRERLGEEGPSGPQAHQGDHQPGIQGLNTAFQSAGHS